MQGFVDRLAVIASTGSTDKEPGTFVKAFDEAAVHKHRIIFVGHSLGCVPSALCMMHADNICHLLCSRWHLAELAVLLALGLLFETVTQVGICVVQRCSGHHG